MSFASCLHCTSVRSSPLWRSHTQFLKVALCSFIQTATIQILPVSALFTYHQFTFPDAMALLSLMQHVHGLSVIICTRPKNVLYASSNCFHFVLVWAGNETVFSSFSHCTVVLILLVCHFQSHPWWLLPCQQLVCIILICFFCYFV